MRVFIQFGYHFLRIVIMTKSPLKNTPSFNIELTMLVLEIIFGAEVVRAINLFCF